LGVGNGVEVLGILLAVYFMVLATDASIIYVRFFLYLISWGCLIFFPHCLMHYLVGSVVGVRFKFYYLGRSGVSKLGLPLLGRLAECVPVFAVKADRRSLSSVTPSRRAVMFASGAVASMILPFIVVVASLPHLPLSLTVALLLLSVANLAFDLYYSPRAGDISRAKAAAG
jgi:hypothetical protein